MDTQDLVLARVRGEILSSIAKHGVQHLPDGTSDDFHAVAVANSYRDLCQARAKAGQVTWTDILLEEVYEALAETEPEKLVAELVQVAAMAAKWAEDVIQRSVEAEVGAATIVRNPDSESNVRQAIHAALNREMRS